MKKYVFPYEPFSTNMHITWKKIFLTSFVICNAIGIFICLFEFNLKLKQIGYVIILSLSLILFFMYSCSNIPNKRYVYEDTRIVSNSNIIEYKELNCFIISDYTYIAARYSSIPILEIILELVGFTYKYRDVDKKIPYPFISGHSESLNVQLLNRHMALKDLAAIDGRIKYVGTCWFDSLEILLNKTILPVYMIEKTYLTHMDFSMDYDDLFNRLPDKIYPCYDGLKLVF